MHVHAWHSEEVRVGLTANEREFWQKDWTRFVMHTSRIVYKFCKCGAVLL